MSEEQGKVLEKSEEQLGSQSLYDKKIEVVSEKDTVLAKANGEVIPYQRRLLVDSDMDETTIEIELVHLPTLGSIYISGYLVPEPHYEEMDFLRRENRRLKEQLRELRG